MTEAPDDVFKQLKLQVRRSLHGKSTVDCLEGICLASAAWLSRLERVPLVSKVAGKDYFAFQSKDRLSRAVNEKLYVCEAEDMAEFFSALRRRSFAGFDAITLTSRCYTAAIGFCCYKDCTSTGDQKTPGTFFEYFAAALFSQMSQLEPSTRIEVLNLDLRASLPTDYIFDYGPNLPKYHLPVKISTRERIIQVWAHQRVLDGVYGTGRFRGIPFIMSETKTDRRNKEVVEICLPVQWQIYQLHIAQLWRIYYCDPPAVYLGLTKLFPPIHVRSAGDLLLDFASLSKP